MAKDPFPSPDIGPMAPLVLEAVRVGAVVACVAAAAEEVEVDKRMMAALDAVEDLAHTVAKVPSVDNWVAASDRVQKKAACAKTKMASASCLQWSVGATLALDPRAQPLRTVGMDRTPAWKAAGISLSL